MAVKRFAQILLALFAFALVHEAVAVAPSLGVVMPRGGQRGTEVAVTLNGGNLQDAADVMFYEPGITIKDLVAVDGAKATATFVIAPDCAVGTRALRLRTKTGVSNMQLFSVGNLKEISETEPNDDRVAAPVLELNTTVNGVVNSEEVDYFPIELKAGDRIAVEVEALRLGTLLFDPKVRLFDPAGREIIAEDDSQLFRQDAGYVYVAKEDGRHVVGVNEASFGGSGDSYYRLHVGTFPRPFSVSPLGGTPGQALEVSWLGDPGLTKQPIVVPAVDLGTREIPAQTEAGIAPTSLPFRVSEFPGVLEVEPNNDAATATAGAAPGAFDGVIAEPGDLDFFKFSGTTGQVYDIRVWARALGSPLDSVVYVVAPSGAQFAGDDDAAAIDSYIRVTLPEDGEHKVYVVDHLKRGGPNFAYRIEVTPVKAKIAITTLENRPFSLTLPQDNFGYLLVNCSRAEFDGPLKLDFIDWPAGVTPIANEVPAGVGLVPVLFSVAPDAAVAGALAKIQATFANETMTVTGGLDQEVRLIEGLNDTTFFGRYNVDRLAVAVSEKAPYKVTARPLASPFVHNGNRSIVIEVARAEGFTAPIDLRFPWLPTGMGGGTAQIPAEQNSVEINLEVRGDCAPNTYNLFVAATSSGWQVCTPYFPIAVEAPWVAFEVPQVQTDQGKPVEMVVKATQVKPYDGEWTLTLTGFPNGISCEPVKFTKDSTEIKFTLNVTPEAPEGKFEGIVARTEMLVNNEPVRHNSGSGLVQVFKPLPPEVAAAAPPPPPPSPDQPAQPERKTRFPS
jgi:hypothetical protein